MISILTASSTMGRAAISRLQTLAPGASINACVRDPSRSANIPNTNVAITDASSYDSLCAALEGSRAAILVTPLDHARGFADDAAYSINAAEAVGVNRIIHVGSWTTQAATSEEQQARNKRPASALRDTRCEKRAARSTLRETRCKQSKSFVRQCQSSPPIFNACFACFACFACAGQKAINFPRIVAPAVNSRDIGDAAAQLLCMPDAELQCSTWLT